MRAREGEGERETQNLKQAPGFQPPAQSLTEPDVKEPYLSAVYLSGMGAGWIADLTSKEKFYMARNN